MSDLPWYASNSRSMGIPWYGFGDTVAVLYRGQSTLATTDCEEVLTEEMVTAAWNNASAYVSPRLKASLNHPAIRLVRSTVRDAERDGKRAKAGRYTWSIISDLPDVRVRRDVDEDLLWREDDHFILGPDKMVLPWPFRDFSGNGEEFKAEDFKRGRDYNPETDTNGNLLLAGGDRLLKALFPEKSEDLDEDIYNAAADGVSLRSLLIQIVRKVYEVEAYDLPETVDVRAMLAPTDATYLSISGSKMTLVLGFPEKLVEDPPVAFLMYQPWPCGAFTKDGLAEQ
ncbi:MAG: hypothetical protein AAF791_00610 [Bacteroidota bacterium]